MVVGVVFAGRGWLWEWCLQAVDGCGCGVCRPWIVGGVVYAVCEEVVVRCL